MKYKEIIDFEKETRAGRLARIAVMYGTDDAEAAETDLTLAKTAKLRADALAAVVRMEEEYAELALSAAQDIVSAGISQRALDRPE